MAADMVYYAARDFYDTAIVVTEDQDFSPAMGLVKELGKHVELAVFPDAQSREMIRTADKILSLDEVVNSHAAQVFPPSQTSEDKVHADEEMAFGV
jgi:uncharacterized LabA/DUF88 family protein